VDEELEMELREDTVAPPEPVLDSGSEDWDLTLRYCDPADVKVV